LHTSSSIKISNFQNINVATSLYIWLLFCLLVMLSHDNNTVLGKHIAHGTTTIKQILWKAYLIPIAALLASCSALPQTKQDPDLKTETPNPNGIYRKRKKEQGFAAQQNPCKIAVQTIIIQPSTNRLKEFLPTRKQTAPKRHQHEAARSPRIHTHLPLRPLQRRTTACHSSHNKAKRQ
jgi:hypothetical protein